MCGTRRQSGNSEEKNVSPVPVSNQIPRSLNQQPCYCTELQQLGDDEHEGHLAIVAAELKERVTARKLSETISESLVAYLKT
jgi:hypothetical protein